MRLPLILGISVLFLGLATAEAQQQKGQNGQGAGRCPGGSFEACMANGSKLGYSNRESGRFCRYRCTN